MISPEVDAGRDFPSESTPASLIPGAGLTQKLITRAQHLRARVRVFEVMIEIAPRDQLVLHARLGKAFRHQTGLPAVDVAVKFTMKQQHGNRDLVRILCGRSVANVGTVTYFLADQTKIGPMSVLFLQGLQV